LAVSRRNFLHHGVLATAACWAKPLLALGARRPLDSNEDPGTPVRPPSVGLSDDWQDHAAALQNIAREHFAGAVGTSFKVVFPGGTTTPLWLTLMAVEDLPALPVVNPASFAVPRLGTATAPVTDGFLLSFGTTGQLQQGSYLFEHQTLGKFAMFTVPDGQQAHTAVVNRLSAPTIIAVPFATGKGGGSVNTIAPAGAVTASSATSSGAENPSPALSGIPGVRRGALRD
jgi:hypothetical protein